MLRHNVRAKYYCIFLKIQSPHSHQMKKDSQGNKNMLEKYRILALVFNVWIYVPLPNFNAWLQRLNSPLPASRTVLNAKVKSPIDHYALVVKRSIPRVVGVVAHFLKVVLLARLNIFQENSDMEVTVGSGVFVHSTWDCSAWWSIKNDWWT